MMKNSPKEGRFQVELRMNEEVIKVLSNSGSVDSILVKVSESLLITDTND